MHYDTWRTSPPRERNRAYVPDTVEADIDIDAGDVTILARGTYDGDSCELVSVTVNGRDVRIKVIEDFLRAVGQRDTTSWAKPMDSFRMDDLLGEAATAALADAADARRDALDGF